MQPDLHLTPKIQPQHLQEWLKSTVDPELVHLNVTSSDGNAPYSDLLYALPPSERRNDGRLRDKWLKKYAHTEKGGWWCRGIDLLTGAESLWGCFKPNSPRIDSRGKIIKYEHPPKAATSIFALRVPSHIWKQIASRYGIQLYHSPLALRLQDRHQPLTFWEWVLLHPEIPLVISEGAKKAGALLTAGYLAIAFPGIYNGYRQPKDKSGQVTGLPHLIPELELLAAGGREIYFAFDQDTKPTTIANVRTAITKTAQLLTRASAQVKVISWSWPAKGVDDLIANYGVAAFDEAYLAAQSLDSWLASQTTLLTYPAAYRLNKRYLGTFSTPPTARFLALRSPKGTGKTEWLTMQVQEAIYRGQPVIILTHRVQLGQALCNRFGVPYVTEIKDSQFGKTLGYGLCVDSLHPNSQAQFQAEAWKDALIIIDECEQVFWHLLNANTEVQTHRVAVLRSLKTLIQTALSGAGKIYLSDADLSDVSIDYVKSLAGFELNPWVVVNEYQERADSWDVFTYDGNNPKKLVADLIEDIKAGGRPMVCLSAQKAKSKWGTRNLEAHLKKLFPRKSILRIDSESVANPEHPAYGCIANLNEILPLYDIVLASPSLETGVSIDIKGHFTGVWIIANGSIPENSVRQAAARLRENVPRHIWARKIGFGTIGNGSTSIKSLLASQDKLTKLNIRLLAQSQFDDEIEPNFQPSSLYTWAQLAARVNLGMSAYRETILASLKTEGHRIIAVEDKKEPVEAMKVEKEVSTTRDEQYQQYCQAVAAAPNPTEAEYQQLQSQRRKTEAELLASSHGKLARRYQVAVSPELVRRDERGWYPQLLLHYYLTLGRQYVSKRDRRCASSLLEKGEGAVFAPDFNNSQMLAQVRLLEVLGVAQLLDRERQFSSQDEFLIEMAEVVKRNRWEIKCLLDLTVNEKDTPIAIAQGLLSKLGLKLKYLGRFGTRSQRVRVYGGVMVDDGRDVIFQRWLERDSLVKAA